MMIGAHKVLRRQPDPRRSLQADTGRSTITRTRSKNATKPPKAVPESWNSSTRTGPNTETKPKSMALKVHMAQVTPRVAQAYGWAPLGIQAVPGRRRL